MHCLYLSVPSPSTSIFFFSPTFPPRNSLLTTYYTAYFLLWSRYLSTLQAGTALPCWRFTSTASTLQPGLRKFREYNCTLSHKSWAIPRKHRLLQSHPLLLIAKNYQPWAPLRSRFQISLPKVQLVALLLARHRTQLFHLHPLPPPSTSSVARDVNARCPSIPLHRPALYDSAWIPTIAADALPWLVLTDEWFTQP